MKISLLRHALGALRLSLQQRGVRETARLAWFKVRSGEIRYLLFAGSENKRDYQLWREKRCPSGDNLQRLKETIDRLNYRPLISVVMPVYDPPVRYLEEAIESVLAQIYPDWELCIADDCSTDPQIRPVLEKYEAIDERIKVKFREVNGHISAASNSALDLASGEYVAFLDHDDLLAPEALFEVASLVEKHPDADLIYSDEDKLDQSGRFVSPYFKPDWAPDNLLSTMYTCHLSVYRREIVKRLGGLREGFEGSQDHDLALRFVEQTEAIYHLPKVLYSWRMHPESAALNSESKDYAPEAGKKAIAEAIVRRGEPGRVTVMPGYKWAYRIQYDLKQNPLISIIIPTRDMPEVLEKCLDSIFHKSTYENFEIMQVDNGSEKPATKALFEKWRKHEPDRYRVLEDHAPFNFSRLNNFAASEGHGDFLLFLNNDTEVITSDWMESMLGQAQRQSIGAVGAKLLYPDNTIQHAGLVLGVGASGMAGHLYLRHPEKSKGYFGNLVAATNVAAVTGACLMCNKQKFLEAGGFDEELGVAYNDVDLCLRFRSVGLNNIVLPYVYLYHHESKSRGYDDAGAKRERLQSEVAFMREKWGEYLLHDPYYNPNLNKDAGDFRIDTGTS